MSERTIPTLEEIAAMGSASAIRAAVSELADVLIVHRRRLDALEVGRSGDGEVPHLPGSWCEHGFRRQDDPRWRSGMAQCAQCAGSGDREPWGDDLSDLERAERRIEFNQATAQIAINSAIAATKRAEAAEREREIAMLARDQALELRALEVTKACAERDAARADVERLSAALGRYGKHERWCLAWGIGKKGKPCTCGLADALKETRA